MKTLTNSEDCSESCIRIYVPASFPAIGRFSPLFTSYWMQDGFRNNFRITDGTIVRAKGGYQNTGTKGFNEDFYNVLNLFLFHMRMRR
jgi:hypothetical protein